MDEDRVVHWPQGQGSTQPKHHRHMVRTLLVSEKMTSSTCLLWSPLRLKTRPWCSRTVALWFDGLVPPPSPSSSVADRGSRPGQNLAYSHIRMHWYVQTT